MQKNILQYKWSIIGLISAAFALLFGIIGFEIVYAGQDGYTILDSIYATTRLFVLDFDRTLAGKLPLSLEIARALAPFAMVTSVFQAMESHISEGFRRFILNFRTNHVVICGLGSKGSLLAKDFLEKGYKVIGIEKNNSSPHLEGLADLGATILVGDATERNMLVKVAAQRARYVVVMLGHDEANVEVAATLNEILTARKARKRVECFLHLTNKEFHELFLPGSIFPHQTEQLTINLFNIYDNSARRLFETFPPGFNVDTVAAEADHVHLLIIGFHRYGESVLLQAAKLGFFYNGKPLRITVVAPDAVRAQARFFQRYPIERHEDLIHETYWKITFQQADITHGDLKNEMFVDHQGGFRYHHVIVAIENDETALLTSINIIDQYGTLLQAKGSTISVLSREDIKLANLLNNNDTGFARLFTFGETNKVCNVDTVINTELDSLAQNSIAHYARLDYVSEECEKRTGDWRLCVQEQEQKRKKAILWENISLFTKNSNRIEKEHFRVKVRELGLAAGIDPGLAISRGKLATSWLGDQAKELSPKELTAITTDYDLVELTEKLPLARKLLAQVDFSHIEKLAMAEHRRWNGFHLLAGWRPGPADQEGGKNEAARLHPCLVPWENLAEVGKAQNTEYKQYDVKNVIDIPDLLHEVGMVIVEK